jgi:hypothetical protein
MKVQEAQDQNTETQINDLNLCNRSASIVRGK